jgi:hypothetical protein
MQHEKMLGISHYTDLVLSLNPQGSVKTTNAIILSLAHVHSMWYLCLVRCFNPLAD